MLLLFQAHSEVDDVSAKLHKLLDEAKKQGKKIEL